jgi:hypothetical protein
MLYRALIQISCRWVYRVSLRVLVGDIDLNFRKRRWNGRKIEVYKRVVCIFGIKLSFTNAVSQMSYTDAFNIELITFDFGVGLRC